MRKIVKYSLFILCIFLFAGCATRTYQSTIPRSDTEITTILSVKNATHPFFEHKTYGEAFASFFALPKWKYFRSAIPEEGKILKKADKKEQSTVEVVEFSGICMYQYKRVKTKIQFLLNPENGTFRATYLSFNDVPQSIFMLQAIIEKAFTTEKFSTEVSVVSDEDAQKKQEEMERELQRQEELARKEAEEKERKRLEEEKKREEERILAEKEKYIQYVKSGRDSRFPDLNFGDAFEAIFFGYDWNYYQGTNEYNQVGKIVEFTGFCVYNGQNTFSKIQFLLKEAENSFEVVSFKLGERHLSNYEIGQMMENIFSKARETLSLEYNAYFSNQESDENHHRLLWEGKWESIENRATLNISYLEKNKYDISIKIDGQFVQDDYEYYTMAYYGEYSALLHYNDYLLTITSYDNNQNIVDVKEKYIEEDGLLDYIFSEHQIKWHGMIFTKKE